MSGIVHLVGAGPGDPGLVTLRALELVRTADVVVHDRLVPESLLAEATGELRYVGKEPGRPSMAQEDINALLVELGRAGRRVVRLKGGDPFVFGRGGEEAQALVEAGVPFEVVPAVTAGIAATAYAGIPVTHRDEASAVAFVTGHEDPGKPQPALDWGALARFPGTLVFYMGVKQLPLIAERLVAAGRPGSEPAAVVERGTLPGQRTVAGTLADIAQRVAEARVGPPAITVVGPVARLGKELAWTGAVPPAGERPLAGRRVVVTRARAQASGLAARLAALGAEVVEAPAIRIEPRPFRGDVERAARGAGSYELVCLTSPNGAALLMDALLAADTDARALAGTRVAAIGPGTARELERRGIRPDVVAATSTAEGLLEALAGEALDGRRVLVARAAEARDALPDGLRARGAEVDAVALYDTVAEAAAEPVGGADYVTFTSSSTVRFFVEAHGPPNGARVVSIGPVTSATARELGIEVHAEAERHDIDGLVDALLADAARA